MSKVENDKRIKVGLEMISAVYELAIACIENNVVLMPSEIMEILSNHKKLLIQQDTKRYINKPNYNQLDIQDKKEANSSTEGFTDYKNYLRQTGTSFEDILAMCFKLERKDFYIFLDEKKINILTREDCKDEFLLANYEVISKEITMLNNKFEKQKLIAIQKRNLLLQNLQSRAITEKPKVKEYKKENFVV